jgi:hypothetical protein
MTTSNKSSFFPEAGKYHKLTVVIEPLDKVFCVLPDTLSSKQDGVLKTM